MRVRMTFVIACTLPLFAAACGSRAAAPARAAQSARGDAIVVKDKGEAQTVPYAPAGTAFNASIDQAVDTRLSTPGQAVTATLMQPILASNGDVLVPEGTKIHGRVDAINHTPAPHIVLAFDSLALKGGDVPVGLSVVSVQESRYRTLATPSGVTSPQAPAPGATGPQPGAEGELGTPQVSVAKGAALKLSLTSPIVQGRDLR